MLKNDEINKGFAFYNLEGYEMKITYENKFVVAIEFFYKKADYKREKSSFENICGRNSLTEIVYKEFLEYFEGKRKVFDFPFKFRGTDFQKKVWEELLKIPYGKIKSYKDIAISIGNPKACRAIGNANNKNPLLIVVPCHRVIGSSGDLTGYAAGLELKKKLLNLEKKYNNF